VPSLFQTAAVRAQAMSPELAGVWIIASSNAGITVDALLNELGWGQAKSTEVLKAAYENAFPSNASLLPRYSTGGTTSVSA
jgi:hypothetical protein